MNLYVGLAIDTEIEQLHHITIPGSHGTDIMQLKAQRTHPSGSQACLSFAIRTKSCLQPEATRLAGAACGPPMHCDPPTRTLGHGGHARRLPRPGAAAPPARRPHQEPCGCGPPARAFPSRIVRPFRVRTWPRAGLLPPHDPAAAVVSRVWLWKSSRERTRTNREEESRLR
jgi:hypothetical protein